jgi:hypothetical protein
MVVEHTFITTLEAEPTMRAALAFLQQFGFVPGGPGGFRLANDPWTSLNVRRGKSSVSKAANAVELPQTVRLEWDRGRVTVAAAMELPNKQLPIHQSMLINITLALEEILARHLPPEMAGQSLRHMEALLVDEARRKRRRRTTTLIVILVLVVALVTFAIVMAAWGSVGEVQ